MLHYLTFIAQCCSYVAGVNIDPKEELRRAVLGMTWCSNQLSMAWTHPGIGPVKLSIAQFVHIIKEDPVLAKYCTVH